MSWLYKLLNSLIICSELLRQVPLNVSQINTQVSDTFYSPIYRQNHKIIDNRCHLFTLISTPKSNDFPGIEKNIHIQNQNIANEYKLFTYRIYNTISIIRKYLII
ncbi:Reverse transcriptase domain-containing protein [Aphis craccivora]|uniref:Reverse transcriptase domain-containing protein n=1 Tax=Aphis craccivora TaxID=307492 RepID=A0A6G0ZBH7_APHCR|nr:Reverse transcriptase domain-containing protein [Aphis craccivora]